MFSDCGAQPEPFQRASKWALSNIENKHPPVLQRVTTQERSTANKVQSIYFSTTFPRAENDLHVIFWTFKIPTTYNT